MIDFINSIVGTPYCMQNVNGVNCWGVVAKYYYEKDIKLKNFTIADLTTREIANAFSIAFINNDHGFKKTDKPKNGDVVVFKGRIQTHCGLLYNGKVLHSSPKLNGVSYQSLDSIIGFQSVEYWAYNDNN